MCARKHKKSLELDIMCRLLDAQVKILAMMSKLAARFDKTDTVSCRTIVHACGLYSCCICVWARARVSWYVYVPVPVLYRPVHGAPERKVRGLLPAASA
jgi:hypothetical protein